MARRHADAIGLLDGMHDQALYVLTPDGVVAAWPAGAELLYGIAAEAMVGEPLARRVAPADAPALAEHVARAAAGASVAFQGWRECAGGRRFWGECLLRPLRDDSGVVVALASLTRDRTAQHLAGRRATERLTRLERLLRQMPAALWTTDPALRVDPAGGVSLERLGLAPDADDDAPLPERVRAAGASPAIVEAHRLALEGRSARCEVRVGDAAFVASVEPLRDESGIVGTIGIALDVSPTLEGWRTPPPAVVHVMHAPNASPRPGAAGD